MVNAVYIVPYYRGELREYILLDVFCLIASHTRGYKFVHITAYSNYFSLHNKLRCKWYVIYCVYLILKLQQRIFFFWQIYMDYLKEASC